AHLVAAVVVAAVATLGKSRARDAQGRHCRQHQGQVANGSVHRSISVRKGFLEEGHWPSPPSLTGESGGVTESGQNSAQTAKTPRNWPVPAQPTAANKPLSPTGNMASVKGCPGRHLPASFVTRH